MGQNSPNFRKALGFEPERIGKSYVVVIGTFAVYLLAFAAIILPPVVLEVYLISFLIFWLSYPVAIHYDKKYIAKNSEWNPSKIYYLGFLPGILGIAFIAIYIQKRRRIIYNLE